jgi:5-methylcytosine-specific restriction endonuclease McrA
MRPQYERQLYGSAPWQHLRNAVLASATGCAWCGSTTAPLTADHVLTVRDRPDLALDPANVVPACRSCQERRKHRPDPATWEPWERRP